MSTVHGSMTCVTAMANWNQPICERDWVERNGERRPVRVIDPDEERCAYCGEATKSGIYVRDDPQSVPFPTENKWP